MSPNSLSEILIMKVSSGVILIGCVCAIGLFQAVHESNYSRGERLMTQLLSSTPSMTDEINISDITIVAYRDGIMAHRYCCNDDKTCFEFKRALLMNSHSFSDMSSDAVGCNMEIRFSDGSNWFSSEVSLTETEIAFWLPTLRLGDSFPTHSVRYVDIHSESFVTRLKDVRNMKLTK